MANKLSNNTELINKIENNMVSTWIAPRIAAIILIGACLGITFSCYPSAPTGTTVPNTLPTTEPVADRVPPTISEVNIAGYDDKTATITWKTDEEANGQVEFGETDTYGKLVTADTELNTTHILELTGLEPNNTYHFRVRSTDAGGNRSESGDQSFTNWTADKDWAKYINQNYGFSIRYPSECRKNMQQLVSPYQVVMFGFLPGVIIESFDADTPISAEWIIESFMEIGYQDVNLVSPLDATILGDGTNAITYKAKYSSLYYVDTTVTAYCLDADRDNKRIRVVVYTVEWCEPYNETWMPQIAHTLKFSTE